MDLYGLRSFNMDYVLLKMMYYELFLKDPYELFPKGSVCLDESV